VLLVVGQGLEKGFDLSVYTPLEAAMFLGIALVLVPAFRGVLRTWVLPAVMRPRRTIIVGAGPVGQLVRRKIEAHPEYGLELVGFVDDRPKGERQLGRITDLTRLVDEREIDWVVIADSDAAYDETLALLRAVRRPDVHLSIVPTYFELFASNATIEDIEGMPVVSLPPMRFSRTVRVLKRSVDVIASATGLLVLSPLLAACAIAIRLDTAGPIFFRQRRHGRGGEEFQIVKFRTMVDGAEAQRFALASQNDMEGGGPLFKLHEDPRITRVGGFLRKWSLDELPQLWNVLRGEMSLVGPRPFVVHESEQITGWAGRRLETTPGITGLWQVLGRNDIPFEEMVKLDYIYVTNWSLWWDIKILCQTLPVVLARRGAY
jgi:exopolysaccharide biosynthesis polyprenyl glycosylphosphotransferase